MLLPTFAPDMATQPYLSFLRQFLCWLLFFQLTRLVFVGWNWAEFAELPLGELFALPFHAIYLDVAMSSYCMGVPYLLFAAALLTERRVFLRINRIFTAVLVVLVSMLTIGELPIYDEWKSKLNYRAISMLDTPSEVVRTATTAQLVGGILAITTLSMLGIWLFGKAVSINVQPRRRPYYWSLPFLLLTPGLLTMGLRGGLQQIPIQVSDAYYSQHNILNIAATNSTFHLLSSCFENAHAGKPYQFMSDDEANAHFQSLFKTEGQDSGVQVLTTQRPNIVLVALEGWSADLIKSCGGYEGVTPFMESMIHDGIFFNNCFASASLSDQGMAAIFSAYPAQPKTSIIREPNKYVHLPCINAALEKLGYHSSFLFGGQLSYGNIRSYMYFNGFDRILEGKDFDSDIPRGKLGVHDEHLYDRQLIELEKEQAPFFAAMFTMSSHSPYDAPMRQHLDWGGKENKYVNSVLYADACLRDFITEAKKTAWYKNTLFVFISDHGHRSPKDWASYQPEYRKIPFLLYGEVIKPEFRGKIDTVVASQVDLVATLLGQLGVASDQFRYSKNLFAPNSPRHAFYTFEEGFCLVKPQAQVCWRVDNQQPEFEKGPSSTDKAALLKEGQAYLQVMMKEYLSY